MPLLSALSNYSFSDSLKLAIQCDCSSAALQKEAAMTPFEIVMTIVGILTVTLMGIQVGRKR